MAKKKYKTHEQLGITFAEWGALWGFKAIAEAGIVLKPVPRGHTRIPISLLKMHPGTHFFDMSIACRTEECGSIACIGGTVALFCQMTDPSNYVTRIEQACYHSPSLLYPLYYPKWNNGRSVILNQTDAHDRGWDRITPAMAAVAVDNFLRTGKPNWDEVIPTALRSR